MERAAVMGPGRTWIACAPQTRKTWAMSTLPGCEKVSMPNPFSLSEEHEQFYSLMKCPLCKQFPIIPNYFDGNGKPIHGKITYAAMDRSAIAVCPLCEQRWPVFSSPQYEVSRQQKVTLEAEKPEKIQMETDTLRRRQATKPTEVTVNDLRIVETDRTEELLGSEQRLIDNSRSAIRLERKFNISKEWSRSCTIDYEKSITSRGEMGLSIPWIGSLKLAAERVLKERYSITEGIKLTYSEEVTLQIPENKKIRVCFEWKRLWQNGFIQFYNQNNEEVQVPFQVAVGITFDQTQTDEQ